MEKQENNEKFRSKEKPSKQKQPGLFHDQYKDQNFEQDNIFSMNMAKTQNRRRPEILRPKSKLKLDHMYMSYMWCPHQNI